MNNKYIFEHITNYKKDNIYPFHMPGHKQNKDFFNDINLLDYDVTEFGDMDNLHNPDGIILNSEKLASKVFDSYKSFYLTNGSSSGNLISIMSTCSEGDNIIVARNTHKSVLNGLVLSGATPLYVYPMETDEGLIGSINPDSIEEIFQNHTNIKAVILTSPTYEGFTSDIEAISHITKKYNATLIVDEAHGAHFNLSPYFPDSATKFADIVIQSLHKTLPTIGQSAIMHVSDNVDEEKISFYRSIFNTTSPSYIIMSLMDYCVNLFYNNKDKYKIYTDLLEKYRLQLKDNKTIRLIDSNIKNLGKVHDVDLSKLTFYIHSNSLSGFELEKLLAKKYNVQVELSSNNHIVALSSICDTEKGFQMITSGINDLEDKTFYDDIQLHYKTFLHERAKLCFTPKEALYKKTKIINFSSSNEKVSAEFIVPYPPGIPIVAPGEIISREIIDMVKSFMDKGGKIIGPIDKKLSTIKIITEA